MTLPKEVEPIKEIIKCVRNVKAQVGAAPSKKVTLYVKTENKKPIKNIKILTNFLIIFIKSPFHFYYGIKNQKYVSKCNIYVIIWGVNCGDVYE